MSTAELKLDIFRKIDGLDNESLEKVYGYLMNFINSTDDKADWKDLSPQQQEAILIGIKELDDGLGISHDEIIAKYRKEYSNE